MLIASETSLKRCSCLYAAMLLAGCVVTSGGGNDTDEATGGSATDGDSATDGTGADETGADGTGGVEDVDLGECDAIGGVISEQDTPLPAYYETYCFPQVDDSVECSGAIEGEATIEHVFFAQTHVLEPDWPFFYLIADRPALVQVAATGSGPSPQVSVSGWLGGQLIGTRCMAGPATLPTSVDPDTPNGNDRFSVTIPQTWLQPGLSVEIRVGAARRTLTEQELGIRHSNDFNTAMINMDVLNYNDGMPDKERPATFFEEWAGSMPGAKVRFGEFPDRMVFPTFTVGGPEEIIVLDNRLCRGNEDPAVDPCVLRDDIDDGFVNAAALRYIDALSRATGEFPYAFYFGHTQHLFPGGWGGGKNWVSGDYHDVTLHEGGHAASLPHWGNNYAIDPEEWTYLYPYGGEGDYGGGHGERWNYHQNNGQFTSPYCEIPGHEYFGTERSDAMQRNRFCLEWSNGAETLWDGFSDFSALAMFRYLNGAQQIDAGSVPYRDGTTPYQLTAQGGFPSLEFDAQGERVLTRYDGFEPQGFELRPFSHPQEWDVPVYTVYGSFAPAAPEANIVYEPMSYTGTLPAVIDPTDAGTFDQLQNDGDGVYDGDFYWPHDITFRFVFTEGEDLVAVHPHTDTYREMEAGSGPWRRDIMYMALSIPGDRELTRIEMYHRPFVVRGQNDETEGNIANPAFGITAENFLDGATLLTSIDL